MVLVREMTGTTVAIRADAGVGTGSGHVVRCLALASELRRRGASVTFLSRDCPPALAARIAADGFGFIGDRGPTADWCEDAVWTLDALSAAAHPDWLVVDHYGLDARWESVTAGVVGRVAVIDDLANRPHDGDLLVDQTPGRTVADYEGHVSPDCRLLLGSDYVMMRAEFAAARARLDGRGQDRCRRLLVSFGGSDPHGLTLKALDAIETAGLEVSVDVVAGSIMPGLVELRRRIAGMHNDVELHVDTEDMAVLMARADMAIGAAGVTAWERCALGLPTLIVIAADNQRANAAALAERGAAQVLGWHADISGEAIARGIGELCSDPSRRERMSRAAIGMCDGRGTARLAEAMCP